VRRRFRPLSRREIWAGAVEHVIAFATGDPTVSSDGMAKYRAARRPSRVASCMPWATGTNNSCDAPMVRSKDDERRGVTAAASKRSKPITRSPTKSRSTGAW
jgi:hypothetical protein